MTRRGCGRWGNRAAGISRAPCAPSARSSTPARCGRPSPTAGWPTISCARVSLPRPPDTGASGEVESGGLGRRSHRNRSNGLRRGWLGQAGRIRGAPGGHGDRCQLQLLRGPCRADPRLDQEMAVFLRTGGLGAGHPRHPADTRGRPPEAASDHLHHQPPAGRRVRSGRVVAEEHPGRGRGGRHGPQGQRDRGRGGAEGGRPVHREAQALRILRHPPRQPLEHDGRRFAYPHRHYHQRLCAGRSMPCPTTSG